MTNFLKKYRFLMLRRFSQIGILVLYFSANAYGFKVLTGTLSSSLLFGVIPLSDPFAVMQMFAAGAILGADVLVGVRYKVIVLALILSAFTSVAAFEIVSPISMLHRGIVFGMGMGGAAVLSIFLFDLFAVKNGWCGHICPLGGFYSVASKLSIIRVKHNQPNCTLCMKCKDVCPEKQILSLIGKESGDVTSGECTNCGRCIEVCDDDALSFGIRNYINKNG